MQGYESLLQLLATINLNSSEDRLFCKANRNGAFSVKSFYKLLADDQSSSPGNFPNKIIQKSVAPPRISFFPWEAAKGRNLTFDNLTRR